MPKTKENQYSAQRLNDGKHGHDGATFSSVESKVMHAASYPDTLIGRLYRGRYRRLLRSRYPFAIFYVVESNRIVVHAFPDLRQDPEKIRERFSESRIFALICLMEAIFVFNQIVFLGFFAWRCGA
jgi:hypothetical protein